MLRLLECDNCSRTHIHTHTEIGRKLKERKIHKIVQVDRNLKLREITEELKMEGIVFIILHEHLSMRKLCSKWVPCLLAVDQKKQRIDYSESCLETFKRNKLDFLRGYVKMRKQGYITTRQNQKDRRMDSSQPKILMSAGKIKASISCDAQGILLTDYTFDPLTDFE